MLTTLLVFICAGLGGLLRFGLTTLIDRSTHGFPYGTLTVNLLGCLALGVLAALFSGPVAIREEHRIALLVGLLGGFTTFSTFAFETVSAISDRRFAVAALYLLLSNGLGLGAIVAGSTIARRLSGT